MAKTAHFRTGKDQYILPLDVKVSAELTVGELVTLSNDTITAASGSTAAAQLSAATHIVALSDETVGGGYIATDSKTYAPTGKVAASTTTTKKVGLYPLFNKSDVIVDA